MSTRWGGEWCSAVNCSKSRKKCPGLSFFRFPKDSERCKMWVINSGRQDLLNKGSDYMYRNCVFCADHFEESQCMNPKKDRLIWNAVPTLFGSPKRTRFHTKWSKHQGSHKPVVQTLKRSRPISQQPGGGVEAKTQYKRCVYVYCRNSTRSENKSFMKGVFFLPVPSTESNLPKRKKWLEACGRSDLSRDRSTDKEHFYVCSAHFEGGNGPTTAHPDPISHCVTQSTQGVKVLNSHHMPVLLTENNNNSDNVLNSSNNISPNKSQTDQRSNEAEEDPVHYEIIVKELPSFLPEQYSLSDIRASYPLPMDWIMCVTRDIVFFTQINETTNCLLFKFTIYKDMTVSLQVLGKDLNPDHALLQQFPKKISDSKALDNCFSILRNWKSCAGNSDSALVDLFTQRDKISGFYCPQTGSVHSLNCTLLTNGRTTRCKMCQLQRMSLKGGLRRLVKNCGQYWQTSENNENEFPNIKLEMPDIESREDCCSEVPL